MMTECRLTGLRVCLARGSHPAFQSKQTVRTGKSNIYAIEHYDFLKQRTDGREWSQHGEISKFVPIFMHLAHGLVILSPLAGGIPDGSARCRHDVL